MTNRVGDIERALSVDPRNPVLWAQLAHAAWQGDDLETARGAWQLAKVLAQPLACTCRGRSGKEGTMADDTIAAREEAELSELFACSPWPRPPSRRPSCSS